MTFQENLFFQDFQGFSMTVGTLDSQTMGLKSLTSQFETTPPIIFPSFLEKQSGQVIFPSNSRKTWRKGSSLQSNKRMLHCNGLPNRSSKMRIAPPERPVMTALPSKPIPCKFFSVRYF